MPITVDTSADRPIKVSVTTQSPSTVTIQPKPDTKVIQLQPGTLPGPKGDSPDRSIYSKREIVSDSPTLELDASQATTFFIRLKMDVQTIIVKNWPNDGKTQRIALYFAQDEIGGHNVVNWPDNSKWAYGQRPLLTSYAGAVDCVVFDTFDGGVTIFAGLVGIDYH